MRESSAHLRTCRACPDSLPDTATPDECSSLFASRPCSLSLCLRTASALVYSARATRPSMSVRGLSVSRAYISPEKPQVEANLRVLLGFLPVFWNEWEEAGANKSICCGIEEDKPN